MKKTAKARLIKYGISGGLCLLAAGLYLYQQDLGSLALKDVYRVTCDAFFLPGVLMVFSGLLVALSNEGALDGVGFVLSYAINSLIPGRHGKRKNYGDYVAEKKEKRVKGYGFLFVTGGVSLAVAIVFLMLYYKV